MCQITIIVPTYNRSYLLRKLILFLDKFKIDCPIIIADCSDEKELIINKSNIEQYNKTHNNQIIHLVDNSFFIKRIYNAIKIVKTTYCKINTDDDFFSKEFIIKSITELNKDKNLVAITGYQLAYHNKFEFFFNRANEVGGKNPLDRIRKNKSNWHPWSVYRTNTLKLILSRSMITINKLSDKDELTNWIKIRYFGFYLRLYSSLFGKIKSIRYCENIVVYHENNWGKKHSNFSFNEILLNDSFKNFLKDIVNSVKTDFNLTTSKSSALVLATLYYDKQVDRDKSIFFRILNKIEYILKEKLKLIYFIIYDYNNVKKILKFID